MILSQKKYFFLISNKFEINNFVDYKTIALRQLGTSNMVNLTHLPNDILLLIFSMVEGDIKDNPFIYLSKNLHMSIKDYNYSHYTSILYTEYCMKNPYSCILPYSLSRLECVSKVCNQVASQIWEPMFIDHIRNGKVYKHPKYHNYKKKYYSKLIPYYKKHLDYNNDDIVKSNHSHGIKSNNASIYLKYIQRAIETLSIDNPNVVYGVDGLYRNYGRDINVISLNLTYDYLVQYRRKAILEMHQYSLTSLRSKKKYIKNKRIYNSLKLY
jgi:hypothetical protein